MVAILPDKEWRKLDMYNQQKKDDGVTLTTVNHLEPRSTEEEDNTKSVKTSVVDNHADTDALRKTELNSATPIDGHRNPQGCSGRANMANKEDTNNSVLPVDLKSKVVILDDNILSLSCYAEEYPENFKLITETKQDFKDSNNE